MSDFTNLLAQANTAYEQARSNEADARLLAADAQTANDKLTAMLELLADAATLKYTLAPGYGFAVSSDEMHKLRNTVTTARELLAELAPAE